MKHFYLFVLSCCLLANLQAQIPACASGYDTQFNDDYTPTHYFPGPMSIPFNTPINGRIEKAGDRDYYKFTVTTGGTITLTLTNLPANYDLKLVNSLGYSLATSARSGTNSETIQFTVASNTVYFAFVYPANNKTFNANACYTLRVATGTASRAAVTPSENVSLFPNPAAETVHLRIPQAKSLMHIRVINPSGLVMMRQVTSQPLTSLSLSQLTQGLYLVEVVDNDGLLQYRTTLIKK